MIQGGIMFANNQVSLRDAFATGRGLAQKVYVVESFVENPSFPLHVRLVPKGRERSPGMLMSASALLDSRLWRRVSDRVD